jgi:hypothetical protein
VHFLLCTVRRSKLLFRAKVMFEVDCCVHGAYTVRLLLLSHSVEGVQHDLNASSAVVQRVLRLLRLFYQTLRLSNGGTRNDKGLS